MTEQAAWRVVSRAILLVFALIGLALLAGELRAVIVQLLLAIIVAAAATPLVDRITVTAARKGRWKPGRGLAAVLVFLTAMVLLVFGAVAIVATVATDLRGLATSLLSSGAQLERALEDLAAANPELASRVQSALPSISDLVGGMVGVLTQASRLVGVATGVFSAVVYLIFTLVLALYLTIDGDRIRRYGIEFLPLDRHDQALEITDRIGNRLGAWARGEALLAGIIGGMTWVGALAIGLPYAGALALIAAVGELVPNLGPIIAAVPLVTVGLLSSPTQGLLALILAILVQQLENNLIVPRVMGQAVNLHPVAVMVAILSGGELLGIPGALMAVPVVASLSVIVDEFQRERRARSLRSIEHGGS